MGSMFLIQGFIDPEESYGFKLIWIYNPALRLLRALICYRYELHQLTIFL